MSEQTKSDPAGEVRQVPAKKGDTYEPPWGANGWPRVGPEGLDEGDVDLLRSCLRRSPLERLESLELFVNEMQILRRAKRISAD